MRCWSLIGFVGLCLAGPERAVADVDSHCVYSLEWLVDASESIQLVAVSRDATRPATHIQRVERVLKGAENLPGPDPDQLSEVVRKTGEQRLLLFLRTVPKKTHPELLYAISLNKWNPPEKADARAAAFREAIPEGWSRPRLTYSSRCAAIDRDGRVLVDPDDVIKVIEKRAKEHPKRVHDRGFLAPRGEKLEDQNSVYFVMAPFDPSELDGFLKQLRSPSGLERAQAANHLAHYPDPRVITALKECLTDNYHNAQLVENKQDRPPRTTETYVVRKEAYESLRKLKVNVPKPELEFRP